MKKIIMIVAFVLLITGCTSNRPYTEIKYNDFVKKIENKETFIFYIGSTDCSYCAKYEKTLKRVVDEHKVEVFYINTAAAVIKAKDHRELKKMIDFEGTPVTIFVRDGEIQSSYNRIEGAVSSEKIIEAFKRNGYIK